MAAVMKVGWLVDDPGYIGGAELTQAEFRQAAPEGVEVVDCPPGDVVSGMDRYVLHNVVHYSLEDMQAITSGPVKFCHDMYPTSLDARVKPWVLDNCELIFCSPLHRERMRHDGCCIPPALDLTKFKVPRQSRRRREGTCSIAQWRNPGKGGQYVADYAASHNGTVHIYGDGEYRPQGPNLEQHGPVPQDKMPQTLWEYETFVFLPFELEPFGRGVAEAWAAGCGVVTNDLVGARYWLEEDPGGLENAAERFWEVVLT